MCWDVKVWVYISVNDLTHIRKKKHRIYGLKLSRTAVLTYNKTKLYWESDMFLVVSNDYPSV